MYINHDKGSHHKHQVKWNHALFRTTHVKLYTLFRTKKAKTIPCPVAHTRISHIREYPRDGGITALYFYNNYTCAFQIQVIKHKQQGNKTQISFASACKSCWSHRISSMIGSKVFFFWQCMHAYSCTQISVMRKSRHENTEKKKNRGQTLHVPCAISDMSSKRQNKFWLIGTLHFTCIFWKCRIFWSN